MLTKGFVDKLESAMAKKNMNELELAEKTGVPVDAIAMMTCTKNQFVKLIKEISDVLEIDPNELLFEAKIIEDELTEYAKSESGSTLINILRNSELDDEQLKTLIENIKKEPIQESGNG